MKYGFLLIFLLGGCAGLQDTVVQHDVQYVERPVPVPCVEHGKVPRLPDQYALKRGAPVNKNTAATILYMQDLEKYAKEADARLRACEAPAP